METRWRHRLHLMTSPKGDPFSTDDGEEGRNEIGEDVQIPSTGISVNDEMEAAQRDQFVTDVVPIKGIQGVAQLITTPIVRGSYEPVRYLLSLTPPSIPLLNDTAEVDIPKMIEPSGIHSSDRTFVLVDVPPYSPQLVTRMKSFMGIDSSLAAILITSRDSIHYDEARGVFSTRKSDLDLWKQAFPDLQVIAFRLDIPRDCRDYVTQILDGYGPFALEQEQESDSTWNMSFIESGRPLTYEEWDHDIAQDVLKGQKPPDDEEAVTGNVEHSLESIRSKERGKLILAISTPGHTFGSVSYIFPAQKVCCSGYTIPIEDTRSEENRGMVSTGPALDCRGYITTSRAGISRQMESARKLVNTYTDRFDVVLPARGDPLLLDGDTKEKKELLLDILNQYKRIGEIYEQLGITGDGLDD